jgi:hypothetical protein
MSKIQNSDVKSESELIAAGATKSSLINDSKIYVSANSINKTLDDAITDGDIGSGGGGVGGINYIDNYDFEKDTNGVLPAGWATYSDAAGLAPVDGTGGTPNTTFLTTTTTPLRGINSSLVTKNSGASRQGEGVSYDFTIDSADQAQVLRISFDYNTSVNYADGDIRIYVYDVTNSRLIEVVDRDLYASSFGKFVGTFQTSPDSTSYRLIFHIASVSALAYTVELDNVLVGPQTIVKGAIVTDPEVTTVTSLFGAATTPPTFGTLIANNLSYSRRGKYLVIQGSIAQSTAGTAGSGVYHISLPENLVADATFIENGGNAGLGVVGSAQLVNGIFYSGSAAIRTTNPGQLRFMFGSDLLATNQLASSFLPPTTATWRLSFTAEVPIQGWSSNVVLSEDAGNREIAFKSALQNPTSATFDGNSNLIFPASLIDTAAGYNTSTGVYTIPESGIYYVKGSVLIGGTEANNNKLELRIYNGASIINVGANTIQNSGLIYQQVNASTLYEFNKGDTVSLRVLTEITTPSITSGVQYHTFEIAKRSSPQTIAASEIVAASYSSTNAESIPSTLSTTLVYETLLTGDTHNAYNTSTGEYTIPQTGWYNASASVRFNQDMLLPTAIISLAIKCGSTYVCTSSDGVKVAGVLRHGRLCSGSFYATKGQIVVVEVFQNSGASKTVEAAGTINIFSIIKINGAS